MDRFSITITAPRLCPVTAACIGTYTYELGTYPDRKSAEADLDSWNRTYQGAWEAGSACLRDLKSGWRRTQGTHPAPPAPLNYCPECLRDYGTGHHNCNCPPSF